MSEDPRDDATLLREHVAGDPDAFGVLFPRHRDRLWAVALRTMGNREDAADGLQDGLVAAYRRAGSYRGEAAVTTWLHRVVVNACLDRLRAAKVRRAEPLPDDLDERLDRGSASTSTPGSEDPAELAVAHERRRAVLDALAALPTDQRVALVLVDLEGNSVADAAAMLGCAEGTVKSRCSRGRARLARRLEGLLAEPTGPPARPSDEGAAPPRPPTQPTTSPQTTGPQTTEDGGVPT